ncbi:hypothetical protein Btru_059356 [Bulinus truncatus]|nr:hypothetical protein Btru_059356 [Bulinus truncatus]
MICLYYLFFLFLFTGANAAACNSGWFGPKCQYLCHCSCGTCDESGQCSSKCAPGWFGLKCQYRDLASIPEVALTTTPQYIPTALLTDFDDKTCNTDPALQSVKISWPTAYPFSWTRFKVKDAAFRQELNIDLITESGQTLKCNPLVTNLDDTTVDYRCNISETVQHVVISGFGVKSLCSVSISGGRNVALKQTATQTSTWTSYGANLAFDSPKSVQRIVLYNRGDCCPDRLKNFKLETLNAANNILWTYQDTHETLPIYTVSVQKNNVSEVRIYPTYRIPEETHIVLTLCEVEIYGECVPGIWGLDCDKTCPQGCSTTCHQDSGQCPTLLGYLDPTLSKPAACEPGWFGSKCQFMCHCDSSGSCDVTGQCSTGCLGGWFGHKCQYQDLTKFNGVTLTPLAKTTWLIDGNDVTCNDDPNLQSLEIKWTITMAFTWLRFKVKDSAAKQVFNLSVSNANMQPLNGKGLVTVIDDTTLDYRFDISVPELRILITGTGLKSLCSVFVSGGRNVALKQTATQTSNFENYGAQLAVDGNTDNNFQSKTCTHTGTVVENLNWTLTLDSPKEVQSIYLYNRGDCCSYRLQKFKIDFIDEDNENVFSYQDVSDIKSVYDIVFPGKSTISKLRIFPTYKHPQENYMVLTLCEVQLYGECVQGSWGLECNKLCPQDCSTFCHRDTGQCPSGVF